MTRFGILNKEDKVYERNLIVLRQDRVETAFHPTAITQYPFYYQEQECFLTINTEYKFRLWCYLNDELICLYTCLGPSYAGNINKLICITNGDTEESI